MSLLSSPILQNNNFTENLLQWSLIFNIIIIISTHRRKGSSKHPFIEGKKILKKNLKKFGGLGPTAST